MRACVRFSGKYFNVNCSLHVHLKPTVSQCILSDRSTSVGSNEIHGANPIKMHFIETEIKNRRFFDITVSQIDSPHWCIIKYAVMFDPDMTRECPRNAPHLYAIESQLSEFQTHSAKVRLD
jgi:hypothetical protein